jgi:hypothetical protein
MIENIEVDTGVSSSKENISNVFQATGRKNSDTSGGRVRRTTFWVVMRDLPLQNTNLNLLRTALFNRILECSALKGLNLACFIVGGLKVATTADFEIYINTKQKIVESVLTEFMEGLYAVPESNISVQVMHVPGENSVNLIKSISNIDTECIWYNDAANPNLICTAKLHSR